MSILKLAVWMILNISLLMAMLVAAAGAGHCFFHRVPFNSRLERSIFTLGAGLGVWGLFLFLLSLIGLLHRELIIALTAIGAIWSLIMFYRGRSREAISRLIHLRDLRRRVHPGYLAILFVVTAYWIALLTLSQYPPTNWDSTAYHLVLAREHLVNNRFTVHTGVPVPITPSLNHLLFSWAMALKGDVLAQMVEHVFLMLTALGLLSWGIRIARPAIGFAGAALWLIHPLVIWLGSSSYVDVATSFYVFLGIYALHVFSEAKEKEWWLASMVMLGAASGVKLPGLFFAGLAAAFGLWRAWRSDLKWKWLFAGGAIALAVALPFYATIFYYSGNPFWPAFPQLSNGVWGSNYVVAWNAWIAGIGVPRTIVNFLLLPYHILSEPARFVADANRGFSVVLIAWPLAWIISIFNRSVRWWTVWSLAFLLFWFVTSQQLRFLLPALPMLGLAAFESVAFIVDRLKAPPRLQRIGWLIFASLLIVFSLRAVVGEIKVKGIPPIGPAGREIFLNRFHGGYTGVRYVNDHAATGDSIYVFNSAWLNYYFKPHVIDSHGLLQHTTFPALKWPADAAFESDLIKLSVDWIIVYRPTIPAYWAPPPDQPDWKPYWPSYKLVFEDPSVWIYHHTPTANSEIVTEWGSELQNRQNSMYATLSKLP